MFEQSKSAKRRFNDGNFHTRYFVGNAIDIGAGPDSIARYKHVFAGLRDVFVLDQHNGDAQTLEGHQDRVYDLVHSSHCLEHLKDPYAALTSWLRVCKIGGHIVFVVPDWSLYERENWPSIFSGEHLWAFTMEYAKAGGRVLHLPSMFCTPDFSNVSVERIMLVRDFFDDNYFQDQTLQPNPECAIEIVLRRTK